MSNRKIHKYYSGKRIDKFVLLEPLDNSLWRIKCDCGKETTISSRHLYRRKSCGCAMFDNRWSHRPAEEIIFHNLYGNYKYGAVKRDLEFNITEEEFITFAKSKCHYCKGKPLGKRSHKKTLILYNGIDRVDSKKGYVFDNCVPCCLICNRAKRDLDINIFLEWLENIKNA